MDHRTANDEAGQQQAKAFAHASMPMMIFDRETHRCVVANDAADKAYGYRADQWKAVSLFDICEARSRASLEARLHDLGAARAGKPDITVQRRRDGSSFSGASSLAPIDNGEAHQVLLCVQDVTQQQEMLAELSLMREHCALAQELSGAGHCVLELKRGRQSWSPQQYRNFGLQDGSVPDDPAGAIDILVGCVHELDRERAAVAVHACINNGAPFDTEWRLRWPDGSERIVRVEGTRKDEPDGSPYALVCASLDLTEKRRIEVNLRQTRLDAAAMFDQKQLADLTIAIGLMNAYNRMAISFRATPAAVGK